MQFACHQYSVLGRPMNNQLVQCASLHRKCMVDWCPHWINPGNQYSLFPGLSSENCSYQLNQDSTVLASWILIVLIQPTFMQPSMGTLNSPSSRVVKDSSPSRHQILRCINFGIGESSPNLVLNRLNFNLVKFEARWILNERALECLIHFVYLKVNPPFLPPSGDSEPRKKKSAW